MSLQMINTPYLGMFVRDDSLSREHPRPAFPSGHQVMSHVRSESPSRCSLHRSHPPLPPAVQAEIVRLASTPCLTCNFTPSPLWHVRVSAWLGQHSKFIPAPSPLVEEDSLHSVLWTKKQLLMEETEIAPPQPSAKQASNTQSFLTRKIERV